MSKSELILNAAMELIKEHGIERTPLSKIAEKAEVGIGTLYKYYKNKSGIINGIYVAIKEEEAELIFVNHSLNSSVRETFDDYYGRMIDYFLEKPFKFNFIAQYAFSPIIKEETRIKAMSKFHHFDSLYDRAHSENLCKDIASNHLTFFVFSSICFWLKAAKELNISIDNSYKIQLLEMAWDSVKK